MNTQMKPKFSVVIPLYNKRKHIIRTIESVLVQSFDDFEVVIIDDGSLDGGANLIQQYIAEKDLSEKITLIRQLNAGVSAARNRGVKASKGELIAFLDADDTWEPHFLAEIKSLEDSFTEAGAYATSYQFLSGEKTFIDPKIRFSKPVNEPRILTDYFDVGARGGLPFVVSSFCIKKHLFTKLGGFPVGEAIGEDQDLFCRVAMSSTIAYSKNVGAFYHLDAENRACERTIPDEPCGFACRLRDSVSEESESARKQEVLNYIASHLLHLASLNVNVKRLGEARKLLSDSLCKLQYSRYLWWKFRCFLLQLSPQNIRAI